MKLTDLHPEFLGNGGPGISTADGKPVPFVAGVGLQFDCPCGCGHAIYIAFENPIGGGAPRFGRPLWRRTGETFSDLTLSPSILRTDGCQWHGWIRNGEIINA